MIESVASAVLQRTVAEQHLRILAGLTRVTGDWDLAEDALQDATERALTTWPSRGLPDNPAAWLSTVARNRAIDLARRRGRELALTVSSPIPPDEASLDLLSGATVDDQLVMLFMCVNTELPMADRIALTLKTVNGLSTKEVARLFGVSEATMGQRLLRCRRHILRGRTGDLSVPDGTDRIDDVLTVVYLTFTGGYLPLAAEALRDELAEEAVFLACHIASLQPRQAEAQALCALVQLLHSHRPARVDETGALVPLDEQDRAAWDAGLIQSGMQALDAARRLDRGSASTGRFRAQAEIAALHTLPRRVGEVQWPLILGWYDALAETDDSPALALARIFAAAMTKGPDEGLAALELAPPQVRAHSQTVPLRADLLRRSGRMHEASVAYREAISGETNPAAVAYYIRRVNELEATRLAHLQRNDPAQP